MAFREQIAWLTLTAMIVAYAVYFGTVLATGGAARGPIGAESLWMLWLFAATTAGQVAAIAGGSALLAARAGRDSRHPADERERAIARRGSSAAYHVLLAGTVVVGVVLPFEASGWQIVNAALFALVVAELVRHGVIVASYRRGWHG